MKLQVATLFDNTERILYVLRNVTLSESYYTLECISFYMQIISNDKLNFYELNTFRNIHSSNNDRLLWTEDPHYRRVSFTILFLLFQISSFIYYNF